MRTISHLCPIYSSNVVFILIHHALLSICLNTFRLAAVTPSSAVHLTVTVFVAATVIVVVYVTPSATVPA